MKQIDVLFGKPKIKYVKKLEIEALKTHGSNTKVVSLVKFKKFTHIDDGLNNLVNWAKVYLNKI